MKILFIVTRSDNIGGSHIHVRDMALALEQEGNKVTILMGGYGPIINQFKESGLNVKSIPSLRRNISPMYDFKAYSEIKKKLHEVRPDIVSLHSSKAGFLGRIAAASLNIPVIFTAHGWSFTSGKSKPARYLYILLEKLVVPKTDFFITVSNYDRSLALKVLGINPEKVKTIHNGMKDIDEKLRSVPGSNGVVNVIKVARFDQQKDHVEFLDAARNVEDMKITFVGDGPLLDTVKQKAEEFSIIDKIDFLGRSDSVDELLANAQIFVLISNWEGFPRSTIEAMRSGLPVIVSDVGGASEAVKHGVNGFVVKKGDTGSLQNYLTQLVHDPDKRAEMGEAARVHYKKNLTFRRMYLETVNIYREILEN